MKTRVNFDPDRSNEILPESRRSNGREAVTSEIYVRQSNSQLFPTILSDLSITGFKMQCFTSLDIDKLVFVTLPGLQTLGAHIRWVQFHDFGCEFTVPLHPAVLDHIVSVLRKY
ncbi:PilZ domain-containing protein [Parasphingorhabdus sp.]|uniref:PilZ domain-containing protein n=1 Tax=Parasphingorhabdus sp. TaxID=2709688 RepID=UPI003C77869F